MGGVATSVAGLGNGKSAGDIGMIRVSQGSESFTLRLSWDDVTSKWVSGKLPFVIASTDGEWTTPVGTSTDWMYWGGHASDLGKWTLPAGGIGFAGALFAAGLQLQDRMYGRCIDGAGQPMMLSPWFYEYNDNDSVVFDNDKAAQVGKTWNGHNDLGFEPSSQNIGHGVVLKSDGSASAKFFVGAQYDDGITTSGYHGLTRSAGWDYVKFFLPTQPSGSALGGVPTTTPYTPTKKYLYPTMYGVMPAGSGAAAFSWECRWSS